MTNIYEVNSKGRCVGARAVILASSNAIAAELFREEIKKTNWVKTGDQMDMPEDIRIDLVTKDVNLVISGDRVTRFVFFFYDGDM